MDVIILPCTCSICSRETGVGSEEMAYQQTVLIPLPRQHLRDVRTEQSGRRGGQREYRNRQTAEMNTILSFFD